jgi:hypothetical protein
MIDSGYVCWMACVLSSFEQSLEASLLNRILLHKFIETIHTAAKSLFSLSLHSQVFVEREERVGANVSDYEIYLPKTYPSTDGEAQTRKST